MKKNSIRVLAWILVVFTIISTFPVSVFAETGDAVVYENEAAPSKDEDEKTSGGSDAEKTSNDTASAPAEVAVATLEDLLAALADNSKDLPIVVTAEIKIPADATVVLDLNGKTVTSVYQAGSTNKHIYPLNVCGDLTIQDTKGNGSITGRGIFVQVGSKLTIDGGSIYAIDSNGGSALFMYGGDVVINGGHIEQKAEGTYNFAIQAPAGTVTVNGGWVGGNHGAIAAGGAAVVINDGELVCTGTAGVTDNVLYTYDTGSITINGGTFVADNDGPAGGCCVYDANGKVTINGGTFGNSSGGDVWGTTGTTIKGGTFENLIEKQHIADGYEMGANGSVVKAAPTEVKVATLAELQAALADNSNDLPVVITETIVIPQGETVVLDLNGKTVSHKDEANKYALNNLGTLTLKDSKGGGSINARGIYNGYGNGGANVSTAVLTIVSGTYNAKGTNGGAAVFNYGEAYIYGGTFTSIGGYSLNNQSGSSMVIGSPARSASATVTANNGIYCSGATLTVNSGKIEGNRSGCHVIYAWNSDVTINGGELYNNNSGNATVMAAGTTEMEINGGTFGIKDGRVPGNGNTWTSCLTDTQNTAKMIVNGGTFNGGFRVQAGTTMTINGGEFNNVGGSGYNISGNAEVEVKGGTFTDDAAKTFASGYVVDGFELKDNGNVAEKAYAAKIGETGYASLEDAFAAAKDDDTIVLLADATPALTSQRAITKAAEIDLNGKTLTLTEDDLYFGTTTFKNGTIVVDPSVKASTAVFWMFANQTLTFDKVKLVATGVTGTYLIGLDGNNSDLNLLNGSEILVENTTALDLDIICVNASTGNDILVKDSKVNVTNLDGRVFFRGNYTISGTSEIALKGITKAGFRIEAGQTLSIEDTAKVTITGEPRDGGIHLTDLTATYTVAETASVEATVNAPKVAQIGENKYSSLAEAIVAAKAGDEIVLLANATVDGTLALPAGIKLTSNGYTITGSIRMLGDLELNGPLTITGGLWVGKSGETLTATLSGDKLTASYFMFQCGTYTINADIDAVYGYLSFEGTFEVNSTIHTTGANGEVLYINGNVTLNDGAVLDSDNSVFLSNNNAVLTMKPGSKVDSNLNITASGAKLVIDATGLTVGEYTAITGAVTNNNGTIEVVNNDKLGAKIVNGKIVLVGYVAQIGEKKFESLAEAFAAAQDGDTITLLWTEGSAPIAMNGSVFGKAVTITGTATVDWSKGFLFVGRGGAGNGTVIFDNANLTSASNNASTGIHVSGREKGTNNKYDGTLTIKNSTIELDYLINKGVMTLDNSTLTVKNGFSVGGRPAHETESGEDATATLNLTKGSKVVVNNHNGMGLGYEAIGVMNIDATSAFETTQSFLVTAKGTMNIAGTAKVAGTLTNNGSIVLTNAAATLTSSKCGNVTAADPRYEVVYADGTYVLKRYLLGSGSEENPYQISSVEDLICFRDSVNAGETKYNAPGVVIALAANIDMAGATWERGIGDGINATFDGIFDGKNFIIKNLNFAPKADSDGYLCGGLYGYTYGAAVIKNLVLENITVTTTDAGHNVGALVGFAYNKGGKLNVSNIIVKNITIDAPNAYGVGAIVGYSYFDMGTIENCTVDGATITGYSFVGGITGYSYDNAVITGCSVKNATITATSKGAGGIAGLANGNNVITNNTVADTTVTALTNWGYVVGELGASKAEIANNTAAEPQVGGDYATGEAYQAKIGNKYYTSIAKAIEAAQNGDTITLVADITTSATITINNSITIDCNGKTITGTDNTTGSFGLINLEPGAELTINDTVGTGKITLTATNNRGWGAYSSVISVQRAKLTVNGGTIEHLGGTDMAYAIDVLTNTGAENAGAVINGGTIKSTYRAIRLFANSTKAESSLTVNGGTIEGTNRSIWVQNANASNNPAQLAVNAGAAIKGDVLLSGSGTTAWDLVLSVNSAALQGNSTVVGSKLPTTMAVKETNGVWGTTAAVATVGSVGYATVEAAFAAAQNDDEVKILVAGTYKVPTGKNITITGAVDGVKFDMAKAVGIYASMTFNNVTFNYGNANYVGLQHAGTMVYNKCTFNGQVFLYGESETFKNCTFNQNSADAYNVWTYGAKKVAFNECTFNSVGKSVLVYTETKTATNDITVTDCDFIATAPADGKAAIEIDTSLSAGAKITIDAATTATGFANGNVSGNSLWNNKKGNNTDANNDITVVVNNETVLVPVTFVAKIGEIGYTSLAEALAAAQDGATIELLNIQGNENKEIEFDKAISFTITGKAPNYALPVITFQNATVNIKDAEILIPELDARQNATINVVDSIVHDAGGNSIAKSYYNGAINIVNSSVYMMQLTTMGYVTISGNSVVNVTWQTNVYGNGMITVKDNAVFNTAALHLTGQDYSGRDNTDDDRVGKPATIIVDGATFNIGKVYSDNGSDYSYNSSKGINIGTIAGKSAVLDVKDGAQVNIYMANGETANIGAGGTVNVNGSTFNVACRAENGKATLANNGTIYVTGTSGIAATVTGSGWVYMNGVTLGAATKLYGAKVAFINGTNNVVGSVIKDGFFSVGVGQNDAAAVVAEFATANNITLGNVTVNVSGNAVIGGNGATYSGWIGSAYGADKTQHDYVLNIENSLAAFGYLHISKDGTLNVKGHSDNKYTGDGANVDFYAGEFIVNGVATFDGTDAWVKYIKMSVDHAGGVLNIINGTNYEASVHNGSNTSTSLKFWKAGTINVDATSKVEIDNGTILVDGAKLNIGGNVTASGAVTGNGIITLTAVDATLTAPAGLTVDSGNKCYHVVYKNGVYKMESYVAMIDDIGYTSLADAIAAVGADKVAIELLTDATLDYTAREAYGATDTISLTIKGNGHTLTLNQKNSDWASIGLANANAKLVLNDITINKNVAPGNGAWNNHAIIFSCNVEMNNVTVNNAIAVQNGATLNNVTINEAGDNYGLWINGNGQSVTMNGGAINATKGRGIKIADQYIDAPESVTLNVTGTKFTTAKKAAVLVSSTAGAEITASNVNIENVVADSINFVHVDENWAEYNANVTVYGATKAQEAVENFVATVGGNYYATFDKAFSVAQAGETITLLADITRTAPITITESLTLDGGNHTLTYTGTDRAIDVPNTASGANVTIKNLKVAAEKANRGLNYNTTGEFTVENVVVTIGANVDGYAINFPGSADGAKVTITNSKLTSRIPLNIWGENMVIDIVDSEITSVDDNDTYFYSAIQLNKDTYGNAAEGTVVTVTGGKITALDEEGEPSFAVTNWCETGIVNISDTTVITGNVQDIVAWIGGVGFPTLQAAVNSEYTGTIEILRDFAISESVKIPAGKTVTIDLNGKTITGTDNATGSFGLINLEPGAELTINDTVGTGKITLKAINDRDFNAYSSVISNQRGKLTVNGGTIEHLGGTDMAYAIDNLTNGKGTYAETIINDGVVKSTYRAIRQFANGVEAQNILIVSGGTIEGANRSIWVQNASASNNPAQLAVYAGAAIKGDVLLSGSNAAEWNLELSVNAAALQGNSTVVGSKLPTTMAVKETNGVWGTTDAVATVGSVGYATVEAAFAAAQNGDEVAILAAGTYKVPTGKNITITGAVDGVEFDMSKAVGINASMTFNKVTFNYGNANYVGLQHAGDMVYNYCIINGQVFLYGESETFNNCTFNQDSADAYNVWTYGAKKVAFNKCTFYSAGKAVLIYSDQAGQTNDVSFTKSTLNASAAVAGKAAIEMDSSLQGYINLTIDGATTATGFGTGNVSGNSLWNNKKDNKTDANNDITVVVDGDTVLAPVTFVVQVGNEKYASLQAAIAAANAGDTITFLVDITEDVTINKNLTIDGANKKYTGTMTVGKIDITVQNVNFVKGCIYKDKSSDGNYTIKNCTFDGQGSTDIAYAINLGKSYSITIENVIAKDYAYGFLQVSNANHSISVKDVEISDVNYGLKINYSNTVELENVKMTEVRQFGIMDSNYGAKTYTLTNCTIITSNKAPEGPGYVTPAAIYVWARENKTAEDTFIFYGDNNIPTLANYPYAIYKLADNATLKAPAVLKIDPHSAGKKIDYINGVYSIHEHSYKDIKTDPTFTEQGYTTHVCSCGDSYVDAYVPALVAVAQIGETKYGSIQEAIGAAQNGQTISLLKDIVLTEDDLVETAPYKTLAFVEGKNITLDMNGKKISLIHEDEFDEGYIIALLVVYDKAGLTIIGNGTIDINAHDTKSDVVYMFFAHGMGTLTIENGIYHADNLEDSMIYAHGNGTVTVNGGTFILDKTATQENGAPWIFNVKGLNSGAVVVNGGTFNADVGNQYWKDEVAIKDGYCAQYNDNGTWTIKAHVEEIIPGKEPTATTVGNKEGVKCSVCGKILVEPTEILAKGTVAKIGEAAYASLAEALAAAKSGETVTLVVNTTEPMVMIPAGVTLDLNGKTLTATYLAAFNGCHVIDSAETKKGLLKIAQNNISLAKDNGMMPVYNGEGYVFAAIHKWNQALKDVDGATGNRYIFQPFIDSAVHEALKAGSAFSGVRIIIRISWMNSQGGIATQDFSYTDAMVKMFLDSYNAESNKYGQQFEIALRGLEDYSKLTFEAFVISDTTGVEMGSKAQ